MKKLRECENDTLLVALLLAGILMVMGAYRIFSYLCENARMNAVTFLLGGAAIRGITGSTDEVIISNALLYLKISAPVIPPMAVLVILRNMLQGIRHTVEPLLASGLELYHTALDLPQPGVEHFMCNLKTEVYSRTGVLLATM